jgi:hypothetical protein
MMVIIVKECNRCKEYKLLEDFYNAKNRLFNKASHCKKCDNAFGKNRRRKNPAITKEKEQKYREKNRLKIRQYYADNKEKFNEQARRYRKIKQESDPIFRIGHSLRCRLRGALAGTSKSAATLELLGCSVEALKKHLENQFVKGMTWSNYGLHGWHIDHIIPCASFDLTKEEEQRKCFHYSNLQPLWAKDNYAKGDKIL